MKIKVTNKKVKSEKSLTVNLISDDGLQYEVEINDSGFTVWIIDKNTDGNG